MTDPSYLSLVSDQYLRTTVIAGRTDLGMPDWRGVAAGQALSGAQISDVVAWLVVRAAARARPATVEDAVTMRALAAEPSRGEEQG